MRSKFTLYVTGHEDTEGESRCSFMISLNSALDGGEWLRHAPAGLLPGKRFGTHCVEGWVGPRAGLEGCRKFRPHRDSIPEPSSP
jgi:hypothetical protein